MKIGSQRRRCCRASPCTIKTGASIPPELVRKIKSASTFNQGFATVEYLSAALVDMKLHLAGAGPIDPQVFERDSLAELGMPSEVVHAPPYAAVPAHFRR